MRASYRLERQVYGSCYFKLEPSEALLIEVVPPEAAYWNFELGDFWFQSLDYFNRVISINNHQAKIDPDGVLRVVVSSRDPGLVNWLDTGGWREGTMTYRWALAATTPHPTTRKVSVDDLANLVPADARRATQEERVDEIRRRRRHVAYRSTGDDDGLWYPRVILRTSRLDRWHNRAKPHRCMRQMEGTETPVTERLEIPKLENSRSRNVAIAIALAVAARRPSLVFFDATTQREPYRGANVTRMSIVKEIRVTGRVELTDLVEVPAPIEGQLVEVLVRPGDEVEEGHLLGHLDKVSAEVAFLVAQAELQVGSREGFRGTEAAVQRAARSLERTERLAAKGLSRASALETARSEMVKAQAAFQAAKAERAAAIETASLKGRDRDRTSIVAPRGGLVLEVPPHTGMMVGPQHLLFRVGAPLDRVHVEAPIGEADIGEIVSGSSGQVRSAHVPGSCVHGNRRSHQPRPETEYGAIFYTVTLTADNPDHLLLPGMTAHVRIKVAEVEDVLAVREASLRIRLRARLRRQLGRVCGGSVGPTSRRSRSKQAFPTAHSPR